MSTNEAYLEMLRAGRAEWFEKQRKKDVEEFSWGLQIDVTAFGDSERVFVPGIGVNEILCLAHCEYCLSGLIGADSTCPNCGAPTGKAA